MFLKCSLLLLHFSMHCLENTTELVHIASNWRFIIESSYYHLWSFTLGCRL